MGETKILAYKNTGILVYEKTEEGSRGYSGSPDKWKSLEEAWPHVPPEATTTWSHLRKNKCRHGKVEIIANDQGNRTTPSYVAFTDTERLIGDAAKNQVANNATNTIVDTK